MAMPAAPLDAMHVDEQMDVWSSHLYSKVAHNENVEGRTVASSGPRGYRSRRQDLQLDERLGSQTMARCTSANLSTLLSSSQTLAIELGGGCGSRWL